MLTNEDIYHRSRAIRCALAINNRGAAFVENSFFTEASNSFEDSMAILKALAVEDTSSSSSTNNYQAINSFAHKKLHDSQLRMRSNMERSPRFGCRSDVFEQQISSFYNASTDDHLGSLHSNFTTISYDSQLGFSQLAAKQVLEDSVFQTCSLRDRITVRRRQHRAHAGGEVVHLDDISSERNDSAGRSTRLHLIQFHDYCTSPDCYTANTSAAHVSALSDPSFGDLHGGFAFDIYVAIVLLNLLSTCVARAQCKVARISNFGKGYSDDAKKLVKNCEKLLMLAIQVITNMLPTTGTPHNCSYEERGGNVLHELQLQASISLLQFLILRLGSLINSLRNCITTICPSSDYRDNNDDLASLTSEFYDAGTSNYGHFDRNDLEQAAENVLHLLGHDEATSLYAYFPSDTAPAA